MLINLKMTKKYLNSKNKQKKARKNNLRQILMNISKETKKKNNKRLRQRKQNKKEIFKKIKK